MIYNYHFRGHVTSLKLSPNLRKATQPKVGYVMTNFSSQCTRIFWIRLEKKWLENDLSCFANKTQYSLIYHSIIILKSPSAQFLDSRVRSHIVSLPLYSNNRCNSSLITVNIVTHFGGVFESLCLTNWYQFCVVINLSSLFDLILIKLQSSSYFFEWWRFLHMDAFCRCFFFCCFFLFGQPSRMCSDWTWDVQWPDVE